MYYLQFDIAVIIHNTGGPKKNRIQVKQSVFFIDDKVVFILSYNPDGNRSFRTQVISYHFGQFVPTFIFDLVSSYPVWSFRTQLSRFVPTFSFI